MPKVVCNLQIIQFPPFLICTIFLFFCLFSIFYSALFHFISNIVSISFRILILYIQMYPDREGFCFFAPENRYIEKARTIFVEEECEQVKCSDDYDLSVEGLSNKMDKFVNFCDFSGLISLSNSQMFVVCYLSPTVHTFFWFLFKLMFSNLCWSGRKRRQESQNIRTLHIHDDGQGQEDFQFPFHQPETSLRFEQFTRFENELALFQATKSWVK